MRIVKTSQFDDDQLRIEDHIFQSNDEDIKYVENFIEELDTAILWIEANVTTPKEDEVGDRSWPFCRDGKGKLRYRLKYLFSEVKPHTIFLKRIIDNKEQNLDIYPAHRLDSYSADDDE